VFLCFFPCYGALLSRRRLRFSKMGRTSGAVGSPYRRRLALISPVDRSSGSLTPLPARSRSVSHAGAPRLRRAPAPVPAVAAGNPSVAPVCYPHPRRPNQIASGAKPASAIAGVPSAAHAVTPSTSRCAEGSEALPVAPATAAVRPHGEPEGAPRGASLGRPPPVHALAHHQAGGAAAQDAHPWSCVTSALCPCSASRRTAGPASAMTGSRGTA